MFRTRSYGGVDVHPSYYGKAEEENRCELDRSRDILEFALIEKALALKLPILGYLSRRTNP